MAIALAGERKFQVPLAGEVPVEFLQYRKDVLDLNPIAYWLLAEPKVSNAPFFDPASPSVVDLPHAALDTPWNGDDGSLMIWGRVADSTVWTDATNRVLFQFSVDGSNRVRIMKTTTAGQIEIQRAGGGAFETINVATGSPLGWFCAAITWNTTSDETKAYWNGSQSGATETGLSAWAGAATDASISPTATPFEGWLVHCAIWNTVLTPAQITTLYAAGAPVAGYEDVVNGLSPFAYWPLNEISGSVADNYEGTASYDGSYSSVTPADAIFADYPPADNAEGTAARDGTYAGVSLDYALSFDGRPSGFFDGVNDYCDINSASLKAAFNGSEGALSLWFKVASASVWTDAVFRRPFSLESVSTSDHLVIHKTSTTNKLRFSHRGSATTTQFDYVVPGGPTDWLHLAMTWSVAADELKGYVNGVQVGTTQTGVTAWSGEAWGTYTVMIGSYDRFGLLKHSGWLNHVAIFPTPLPLADIETLAAI